MPILISGYLGALLYRISHLNPQAKTHFPRKLFQCFITHADDPNAFSWSARLVLRLLTLTGAGDEVWDTIQADDQIHAPQMIHICDMRVGGILWLLWSS